MPEPDARAELSRVVTNHEGTIVAKEQEDTFLTIIERDIPRLVGQASVKREA